ncbi:MAG TPA: glycosyltransferase family 9 protein [Bryobacteraceae bacterium]|nr:glycosyltransferase family 9 protein [Bryobacteraceae bacterium]
MPRRLIIRPGAIGDFILSLPAMEHLKADFLEVWAASTNLPLARFAHSTRSVASTGLDMLEFSPNPRLTAELCNFNSIVSWYGTSRPEFRAVVKGLPFEFLQALPPQDCQIHAADFFAAQVGLPGLAIPHIDCPRRDDGFAVIHPFSGSAKKCWPLERYRELANRLEAHMPIRWCVGPEEPLPGAVRIDDLYELACWLASARVYVGNDSGITHLAAAVGTPVVALFGPTDPRIWGPRGPNVRVIARPSLEHIDVEEVAAAVLRYDSSFKP